MGVHGLWKLLEPAGKAVALESLQNKILGVDVSIWLHQAMKGFQDRKGSPLPNAHLLGIFHRVCKLLFYRIKPVFVFDGGVPILKKDTIASRRKLKGRATRDAKQVAEQLLKNLVKHKAVRKVLGEKAGRNAVSENFPRKDENLFELPPMLNELDDNQSLSSDSEVSVKYEASGGESDSDEDVKYLSPSKVYAMNLDLHTLDVSSENFRSLPADVRHDILSDLKETRKQSSWGRLHEMPKESTDFSSFQLNRLLKRRTVQVSLEEAEKEMGGKVLSMAELEDIMSAQGVKLEDGVSSSKEAQLNAFSKRIASDVATRYLLVSGSLQSKNTTSDDKPDTKGELKEDAKEKTTQKVKIKNEHEDDWSSDDESIKEVEVENKLFDDKIKIKQEYENDWSSDNQAEKLDAHENLAQQFVNEKDSLSQAEIFALIQNEKSHNSNDGFLMGVPSTSKGVSGTSNVDFAKPNTSKADFLEPSKDDFVKPDTCKADFEEPNSSKADFIESCTSKADFVESSTSKADFEKSSTSKDHSIEPNVSKSKFVKPDLGNGNFLEPISSKSDLKTPTKEIIEVRDKSPVSVKSDSDNDFDEVMPVEPEIIERIVRVKPTPSRSYEEKQLNIEVVIDKNQSYKAEDDIFADIFPVSAISNKELHRTPEKTKPQPEKIVMRIEEDKEAKSPVKTGELQERIENFIKERIELQKKVEKTSGEVELSPGNEDVLNDKQEAVNQKNNIQKSKDLEVPEMTSEELKSLESALEDKHEELLAEKGRQERLAASITDQMCAEAQELLRLFGVPYIVAPMEAEAQCAFLDALSLTEGTITDDSDIWLFGGNKVYKNFFNQKKHVLQYTATTIQHYLKLERHHMVLLALLVGSDYTTGLQGIGPVTAMEVLAAFPAGKVDKSLEKRDAMIEGLRRFRDWWQAGRPQRSAATTQLRNKVRDVQFYEGFPSLAVVDAYLRPAVDESREAFSWGDLDLDGLREFARMKFGWAQAKADEILLPVAKRVAERKSQRFIDSYFKVIPQYGDGDKKMSKRVKKAIRRMENEEGSDSEEVDDPGGVQSSEKKSTVRRGGNTKKKGVQENDEADSDEGGEKVEKANKARRRTNTGQRKTVKRKKQDTNKEEDLLQGNIPKMSKIQRAVGQDDDDEEEDDVGERSCTNERNDLPKPRPRQRTSTGVIRTGAKGTQSKTVPNESKSSVSSKSEDKEIGQPRKIATKKQEKALFDTIAEDDDATEAVKTKSQPRKTATKKQEKVLPDSIAEDDATEAVKTKSQTRKRATKRQANDLLDPIAEDEDATEAVKMKSKSRKASTKKQENDSLVSVAEDNYATEAVTWKTAAEKTSYSKDDSSHVSSDLEPKPGTSKDVDQRKEVDPPETKEEDPDEEEEAVLAALHAMDWDDDPWGGFQPPREKMYFGGVRKNPSKPRRVPPPQPLPPPPPAQPIDTRGYRPGARTLDRIESRITQPQMEWNTPSPSIPQRERDRQQVEESKMKAIKLFKAAGAMKSSKFLGEDPASSKRKLKKKKTVAKVKELNLSEESSSDD